VNAAVEETVRASGMAVPVKALEEGAGTFWSGRQRGGRPGDRRAGVVWHTQGSGKSFSMLFFAARVVRHPAMQNPTLVVLTDRNDLDDQLFGTFADHGATLRGTPRQAETAEEMRRLLAVDIGGLVFTTIQRFRGEDGSHPLLTDRNNVIVIADEAHRTQYGFKKRYIERDGGMREAVGFADYLRQALPHATVVGFTGTPIEERNRDTYSTFGDVIDTYDIYLELAEPPLVVTFDEGWVIARELRAKRMDIVRCAVCGVDYLSGDSAQITNLCPYCLYDERKPALGNGTSSRRGDRPS
jgi:type I restriction enzyme R subunit